jgi:hypothetical protein
MTSVVLVVFHDECAGLGATLCGGTMGAGDLLLLFDHVEVTNMEGGIDWWIPPSH